MPSIKTNITGNPTFKSVNNSTNPLTLAYSAIVGTSDQVISGTATHSTISAAITAISAGQKILILPGIYGAVTDTITVSKQCLIEGFGNSTVINGSIMFTSNYCKFTNIKVNGNITVSSNYCDLSTFWTSATSLLTNTGNSNYILGIKD